MSNALKNLLKERKSDSLQDEIRRRVLARYSELQEQESEKSELEATLDALQEMTGLPKHEIDKIANEVQESNRDIEIPGTTLARGTNRAPAGSGLIFKEFDTKLESAKREFIYHLVPYGMVNTTLIVLNLITSSFPWAMFPLFFWGIGIVSHYLGSVHWPRKDKVKIVTTITNQLHQILNENCPSYRQDNRSDMLQGLYRLTVMKATQLNIEEYLKNADQTLSDSDVKQISTQVIALQQQYSRK